MLHTPNTRLRFVALYLVFGIRWPVLGAQCLQLQCQMAEAAKDQSRGTKAAPSSEWKENHTNLTGNNNNKNKNNKI